MKLYFKTDEKPDSLIEINQEEYLLNGEKVNFQLFKTGAHSLHLIRNNKSYSVDVISFTNKKAVLKINDHKVEVEIKNYLEKQISDSQLGQSLDDGIAEVNAPMPGTILDILVKPGQKINKNDTLLILNAMKMENVIKTPMKGKVKTISVSKGENVNKNQLLISFE